MRWHLHPSELEILEQSLPSFINFPALLETHLPVDGWGIHVLGITWTAYCRGDFHIALESAAEILVSSVVPAIDAYTTGCNHVSSDGGSTSWSTSCIEFMPEVYTGLILPSQKALARGQYTSLRSPGPSYSSSCQNSDRILTFFKSWRFQVFKCRRYRFTIVLGTGKIPEFPSNNTTALIVLRYPLLSRDR